MKKTIVMGAIGAAAIGIAFIAFSGMMETKNAPDQKDPNIKQLVSDYSSGSTKDQSASITSHQLIVTNPDETKEKFDLPENEFFVSIAPYVEDTHPCDIHSLTGCRGEMADQEFLVRIEDEDGNIVVDQALKSGSNGFIDLWLPSERNYRIRIVQEGKSQESKFSTFKGDNTCITTIQLM